MHSTSEAATRKAASRPHTFIQPIAGIRLLLIAVTLSSPGAAAAPIFDTTSSCVALTDNQSQVAIGPTAVNCSQSLQPLPLTPLFYTASGEAASTVRPRANPLSLMPGDLSGIAAASGSISYDSTVVTNPGSFAPAAGITARVFFTPTQKETPPFLPDFIPFSFEGGGLASVQGEGFATAQAQLIFPGGAEPAVLFSSDNFPRDGKRRKVTSTHGLRLGLTYGVVKVANCTALVSISSLSSRCTVFIDPVITFDQDAFDAQFGDNSFTLADYFALDVNPNFIPVPEVIAVSVPPTLVLLGLGLAGLGLSRRTSKKL